MALIELGFVTFVALIVSVRSKQMINKGLVTLMWSVFTLYSMGVRP